MNQSKMPSTPRTSSFSKSNASRGSNGANMSPSKLIPMQARRLSARSNKEDRMIKRLLCMFGKHDWKFMVWPSRGGMAVGDKCIRCGLWSARNSIRVQTKKEVV